MRILLDKERNLWKDDFGRVICIQKKDFWDYCRKRSINLSEILKMSFAKRMEFYLRWKHGLSDPIVNEELESSEWASYGSEMDIPIDKLDPYFAERIISWRNFEKYCYKIKLEIKLVGQEHPEPFIPKISQKQDKNWQD